MARKARCSRRSGLIDRMIVDQPFADPPPFMGPVIDLAAADHVQEQWLELMMKGGKPLRRLDRPFEERPYLTPALIDVTEVRDRPDEEIFGPVLQVIRVKDFDAAIDEANNTRFGLAASLIAAAPSFTTNSGPTSAPASSTGTSRPTARHPTPRSAASASPATIARAPSTPPIIAPIQSPAAKPNQPRAAIGEGLRDPNLQED